MSHKEFIQKLYINYLEFPKNKNINIIMTSYNCDRKIFYVKLNTLSEF